MFDKKSQEKRKLNEKLSRGGGGGAKALKNIINHTPELKIYQHQHPDLQRELEC